MTLPCVHDASMRPWPGELPAGWGETRLKWLVELVNEKTTSTDRPYLGLENVEPWTGRFLESEPGSAAEGQANLFERGDVLFGKLRPYLAKVFRPDSAGRCTSEFLVLRPKEMSSAYLRYSLSAEPFIRLVDSSTYGAKMPRADWEFIGRVVVPCPPLPVQADIVAFLDRKTAAIDALVKGLTRLRDLVRERDESHLLEAVAGRLDGSTATKGSGLPWLGPVPQHWTVERVKYVSGLETGHTPSKTEDSYWVADECTIPWVSLADTKALEASDFISDSAVKISATGMAHSAAHLIESGAVVFNRDGARVGLAAITTRPMAVSQHVIGWVCGSRMLNTYLLHVIYAMEPELYRLTSGATIPTIGMDDVKHLTTPVPPMPEQEAIVARATSARAHAKHARDALDAQIRLLAEYRQAIVAASVTGQLSVSSAPQEAA